jgi:hemerythrin
MQWTEDLSVGVETIDNQHKELFRRINSLVEAIKQGKCKTEITGVIMFLEEYALSHFGEEETFMKEHAYPPYHDHKAQHAIFIKNLSELRKELEDIGPSYVLSVTTNQVIVDWIIDHIAKTDKKLGRFLQDRSIT